jgi:hypothetical protein
VIVHTVCLMSAANADVAVSAAHNAAAARDRQGGIDGTVGDAGGGHARWRASRATAQFHRLRGHVYIGPGTVLLSVASAMRVGLL